MCVLFGCVQTYAVWHMACARTLCFRLVMRPNNLLVSTCMRVYVYVYMYTQTHTSYTHANTCINSIV